MCHVLQLHVLHFHALQFWWSVIFMSVIFSALQVPVPGGALHRPPIDKALRLYSNEKRGIQSSLCSLEVPTTSELVKPSDNKLFAKIL